MLDEVIGEVSYPLYFTVVLGLYLKQHLFQNKLQGTGLSPSLMFLAI